MPLFRAASSPSEPASASSAPASSAETPRIDGPAASAQTARDSSSRSQSDSALSLGAALLSGQRAEEDHKLARGLLRSRRARGSYTVSLGALLVCLMSLPFCLYVGIHFRADHGLALIILTMSAAAYEGVMLLLFRSGRHRP